MAELKLASSTATIFFFCFLSLSSALASSSDIPEATSDGAPRDTPYDDLIVLPSSNTKQTTILPDIKSEESSSVPVDENLFAVDLTEVKGVDRDDLPGSVPLKEVPFHHHHHHHHQRPERSGRKEISYGNDMILSSHESFGNSGFEEDEGFGEEDDGLRKFHHHHHHHHHHHRFDHGDTEGVEDEKEGHPHGHKFHQRKFGGDEEHPLRHGEVEGVEDEKEGHPHGHRFHQRKFGGDEEHPSGRGFHHHRHHHHHHHHHDHEEEEHEERGLLCKLRKFLNGF